MPQSDTSHMGHEQDRRDKNDLLYQVFHDRLHVESEEEISVESLAIEVIERYLRLLADQGVFVPIRMKARLEDDLLDDVLEMIRKKTYGHVSIRQYRHHHSRRNKAG